MPPVSQVHASVPRARSGRLLGDVIVGLGFCSREAVEDAVVLARESGRQLGQVLLERSGLSSDQLATAVAERFGLQYCPSSSPTWRP